MSNKLQRQIDLSREMVLLAPHTQRAYLRWIERYLKFVHRIEHQTLDPEALQTNLIISSLQPKHLAKWLKHLQDEELATRSIRQARSAVLWLAQASATYEFIAFEQVAALQAVNAPRNITRTGSGSESGTWLTKNQTHQLLSKLHERHAHNPAMLARDHAIILLMVICGLRRSEVTIAQWKDLSEMRGEVKLLVHGKGEKNRLLKLPQSVNDALTVWKGYHSDPSPERRIFVNVRRDGAVSLVPITDQTIWNLVQDTAKEAGLPRITPHDLRRTFARGAYEAGASFEHIRQVLGHTSVATTEKYIMALPADHTAADMWEQQLEQNPIQSLPPTTNEEDDDST